MKPYAAIFLISLTALDIRADTQPSFALQYLIDKADAIVLVSEGKTIDGEVIIVESLRGSLSDGDVLHIDSLKLLQNSERRRIHASIHPSKEPPHTEVTCNRMILFLAKSGQGYVPLNEKFANYLIWLCWIEDDVVYARVQEMNPGTDTQLIRYHMSAKDLLGAIKKSSNTH